MSVSNNNLTVGIEVEYPIADRFEHNYSATYNKPGLFSDDLEIELRDEHSRSFSRYEDKPLPFAEGKYTKDSTVGLEVISPKLDITNGVGWYETVLDELDKYEPYEPTGLLKDSTAGLHIHLSEISSVEAEILFNISNQPWMQTLACTSITNNNHSVFRGGTYCKTDEMNSNYAAVRDRRGEGHYEWRLPEPMEVGNLELVLGFLSRFKDNPEDDKSEAINWGKKHVYEQDSRITSFKRAKESGLTDKDLGNEGNTYNVHRSPTNNVRSFARDFFYEVCEDSQRPYIYIVESVEEDEMYIGFYSRTYADSDSFTTEGQTFNVDTVFHVDNYGQLTDVTYTGDAGRVRTAITEYENISNKIEKSQTTDYLQSILQE